MLQDTSIQAVFIEEDNTGINSINPKDYYVYSQGREIIIESDKSYEISLYDIYGKKIDGGRKRSYHVSSAGIYLVKIGNHPARKVVVIG